MNRSNSSLRTIAVLGAGLALTLTACGGGDDDAAEPAAVPSSPTTVAPPDQDGDGTVATDDGVGDETSDEATNGVGTTDGTTDDAVDDGATITIADFAFGGVTEVAVGTTVVVTNTDASPHTWSADGGAFDSGALGEGETFEFTFTEAGEFAYHCNFHPSMTGTIVVTG